MSDLGLRSYVPPRYDRYEYGSIALIINTGESGPGAPIGMIPTGVGLEVDEIAPPGEVWDIINDLGAEGWYINSAISFGLAGDYVYLQYVLMRVNNE